MAVSAVAVPIASEPNAGLEVKVSDPLITGVNLTLEATAAEVAANLRAQGIEAVLLRGPALTEWLYGDAGRADLARR